MRATLRTQQKQQEEHTMRTYKIYEYPMMSNPFAVWCTYSNGNGEVVKTFKTRKGAENWIRKHS
jgi:hypothetical protein